MVDRSFALSTFQGVLRNETSGSTCIPQTDLSATFSATCSLGVTLSFTDIAGPGQMSSGDHFRLTGVVGGNLYTLRVVWKATAAVIASEVIGSAGPPPTIALNASPVGVDIWEVQVTVDRPSPLSSFQVLLRNETSGSTCIPQTDLSATFSATCSAGVTLSFNDIAGSNQMTTGDLFRLTGVTGANSYTLQVVWKPTSAVIASELIG